jgi:uncharacterized damage-inducible protein DinB
LLETRRIEDQLNRSFRGEAWHGPCLSDLLRDVSFAQAADRPLPGVHSIWEIVLHITAWIDVARRRMEGEPVELSPAQDWPAIRDPSDAGWQIALGNLEGAHEKLRGAIAVLDPERLDERVRGKPYSIYFLLHGVIQHNLYHAGQIAILKKALPKGA